MAFHAYVDAALAAAALEAERSALERKRRSGGLTPDEEKRLAELPGLIDQSKAAFLDLIGRLDGLLGRGRRGGPADPPPAGMDFT
jgi:hypothetical protein